MLVISVFVILIHLYLKAFHYDISRALGACWLDHHELHCSWSREGYALRHGSIASFIDGLANAFGYALVLLCISWFAKVLVVARCLAGSGLLRGSVLR